MLELAGRSCEPTKLSAVADQKTRPMAASGELAKSVPCGRTDDLADRDLQEEVAEPVPCLLDPADCLPGEERPLCWPLKFRDRQDGASNNGRSARPVQEKRDPGSRHRALRVSCSWQTRGTMTGKERNVAAMEGDGWSMGLAWIGTAQKN